MRCAICGQDVRPDEASVPASDEAVVHVVCADREAARAWVRRQHWALAHALVIAAAVALLLWVGIETWSLMLIGIGVITHVLLHRRFWSYIAQDACRWLRRRAE